MGADVPRAWLNPSFGSFDDFGSAMLILYIAATGDGWEEFMWAGMDAVGQGIAPERNDMSGASTYFLAWMIVGCFISLNLFVGAIVDNFTRIKQEDDGSATMTPEQQQWADALKSAYSNKAQRAPRKPEFAPRRAAFSLGQVSREVFGQSVSKKVFTLLYTPDLIPCSQPSSPSP